MIDQHGLAQRHHAHGSEQNGHGAHQLGSRDGLGLDTSTTGASEISADSGRPPSRTGKIAGPTNPLIPREELRRGGHARCASALISNGHWLFATATSRLHWLTRRAPFCKATLADPPLQVDVSALSSTNDVVTILSTEPLTTDEHWQPFQAGESLLLQAGEVIQRSRHGVRPVPISASSRPASAAQTSVR
ncbi:MAG: class II glutamine amidotransferase [Cyanobacteriota bacterium]|nr:class II glutamine amidotransferase [Cyanobacteriota bacterium]